MTVVYMIDDTTHDEEFVAHKVKLQMFGDPHPPRRTLIRCYDRRGALVESFECMAWTLRKTRVAGDG